MITGDDLVDFAGRLVATTSPEEVACRTAINRAYYGALHAVIPFLDRLGVKPGKRHGELQIWLKESGHVQAVEIGKSLTDLYSNRYRADYLLSRSNGVDLLTARDCVEMAADICTLLRQIDNDADRQLVKAGIEAYRQRVRR